MHTIHVHVAIWTPSTARARLDRHVTYNYNSQLDTGCRIHDHTHQQEDYEQSHSQASERTNHYATSTVCLLETPTSRYLAAGATVPPRTLISTNPYSATLYYTHVSQRHSLTADTSLA
ncbi:hypothetical protein Tco_1265315 [Tanacetum coccineum]